MSHIYHLSILLFLAVSSLCFAQGQTLTFTSTSDAKFFVYLNGKLQNQKSSGMVTLKGLEDKDYHVRIVIDDPYEIATTQSIRPDKKHNEYTVQFNAVRERVYLKPAKNPRSETEWQPQEDSVTVAVPQETVKQPSHVSIRPKSTTDTSTKRIINQIRQQIEDPE